MNDILLLARAWNFSAKRHEKARQATAKAAEADKARQAAEAKAAEATFAAAKSAQARQAAEVHAAEADKARLAAVAGTVTSGPASPSGQFSRKSNMEARGTPEHVSPSPAASTVDCEQTCARSTTCKVYTYYKKGGSCITFSVADLSPNDNYDSGIRK